MKTIVIANNKGGVGKSETAKHLGRILAARRHETVLIDLDPQANLTDRLLGSERGARPLPALPDALTDPGVNLVDVRRPLADNLWLLPADERLDDVDSAMVIDMFGIMRIDNMLRSAPALADLVLIDCPPNLGALTTAALIAADWVLIPTQPEPASIAGIERIERKLNEIYSATRRAPSIAGTVATFVQRETNLHKAGLGALMRGHMPPMLGCVPQRKGEGAETELAAAYEPVADQLIAAIFGR